MSFISEYAVSQGVSIRSTDTADDDSTFGGDDSFGGADTLTLSSDLTDYIFENGRRYHSYKDGAYWGPNDDRAKEQQELTHQLYLMTLDDRLYLAPLEHPHTILDIGTGTGCWAIDFADAHPDCHVLGNDLSACQPEFVPMNCSFEVDDVTQTWTHPENYFDFIHIREMYGSIPDWQFFIEQAFRHTKPGGWVEIVEHSTRPCSDDASVGEDHFFNFWADTVEACGRITGKSFDIWQRSKSLLEKAGFQEVHEVKYRWPINRWCKDKHMRDIGRINRLRMHDGCEDMMIRPLTASAKWTLDQVQAFLSKMKDSIRDRNTHAFIEGTVVYGRKPTFG